MLIDFSLSIQHNYYQNFLYRHLIRNNSRLRIDWRSNHYYGVLTREQRGLVCRRCALSGTINSHFGWHLFQSEMDSWNSFWNVEIDGRIVKIYTIFSVNPPSTPPSPADVIFKSKARYRNQMYIWFSNWLKITNPIRKFTFKISLIRNFGSTFILYNFTNFNKRY